MKRGREQRGSKEEGEEAEEQGERSETGKDVERRAEQMASSCDNGCCPIVSTVPDPSTGVAVHGLSV